jgi:hypothetical protein
VEGRVVWVQRHDPDGDGDRHVFVVSRLHVRIVKIRSGVHLERLPSVGSAFSIVGFVKTGGSGHEEIDATARR